MPRHAIQTRRVEAERAGVCLTAWSDRPRQVALQLPTLQKSLNDLNHGVVDMTVGGDQVPRTRTVRTAGQIRHASTRFLNDECSGGNVPRMQRLFPEAIETAGR